MWIPRSPDHWQKNSLIGRIHSHGAKRSAEGSTKRSPDYQSNMPRSTISWSITIIAIIVAAAHLLWPAIAIDAVILTLLVIAIIPWLAPLFKAVELPGGLKVEFADLEKTRDKAQSAGLLTTIESTSSRSTPDEIADIDDPNLALAALRIALERRLRKIARRHGISIDGRRVGLLLQDLQKQELLSRELSSLLSELLPSLDAAVHGAEVDPRASQWAAEVGPRLMAGLEFPEHIDIDELVDRWRRRDGAAFQEVGCELSEAVVKSPQEFLHSMASSHSEFDAWLEGLPYHTFTIYESRNALQDDLYTAYYERLRALMTEAVSAFHDDPQIGHIAKQISDALLETEIRAIQ